MVRHILVHLALHAAIVSLFAQSARPQDIARVECDSTMCEMNRWKVKLRCYKAKRTLTAVPLRTTETTRQIWATCAHGFTDDEPFWDSARGVYLISKAIPGTAVITYKGQRHRAIVLFQENKLKQRRACHICGRNHIGGIPVTDIAILSTPLITGVKGGCIRRDILKHRHKVSGHLGQTNKVAHGTVTKTDGAWLTTDIAVQKGDSGSAVVDENGDIVGLVAMNWKNMSTLTAWTQITWALGKVNIQPGNCRPARKPEPEPAPPRPDLRKLEDKLDKLTAAVAALAQQRLKPGPKGDPGEQGPTGPRGPAGQPGKQGTPGRGITSARIDSSGHLILSFTDGTTQSVGRVSGRDGKDGLPGTVNVLVHRDGKPAETYRDVRSGSRVRIRVSDTPEK